MNKFWSIILGVLCLNPLLAATNTPLRIAETPSSLIPSPPMPPEVTRSNVPTRTTAALGVVEMPAQYAKVSWKTNSEAETYIVESSVNLQSWKEEGRYSNTNSAIFFVANYPIKFFKVYGHAEEKTNHFVQLAFDYANDFGVDEFRIYSGTNQGVYPDVTMMSRADFNTNTYYCTVSNLQANTTYYFRAIAIDSRNSMKSDYTQEEVAYSTPTNKWKFHKMVAANLQFITAPVGSIRWVAVPQRTNSAPTNNVVDKKINNQ